MIVTMADGIAEEWFPIAELFLAVATTVAIVSMIWKPSFASLFSHYICRSSITLNTEIGGRKTSKGV